MPARVRQTLLLIGLLLPLVAVAADLPLDLPGAPPLSAAERARRGHAAGRLAPSADTSPRYVNRLVDSASPYLELHALQPVDWYPWGDEALARARAEDKPILLSIGYSTCHWCHVMAAESFADPTIAAQINRDFVAIKVDREERPDLDAVYIDAVQQLTGSAGWPLTVFLTPDGQPFFGGTYFPPADRDGRVGMPRLLSRMAEVWRDERDTARSAATDLLARLAPPPATDGTLDRERWHAAVARLRASFDREHGGLRGAPKFPPTQSLLVLLRQADLAGDADARHVVELTLDHMAAGALHDPLGGGFHRYTVDAAWRRPHFEKMLYDQALLARVYLEAFQYTRAPRHAAVARAIFHYVQRDLTAPDGTFLAAEDAVSGGVEGGFYLWDAAQVHQAVGPERIDLAVRAFGIGQGTEPRPPRLAATPGSIAADLVLPPAEVARRIADLRDDLRRAREQRPRPRRDDKILPAWNGLMIAALAYGARVLDEPQWAVMAARGADALLARVSDTRPLARAYRRPPGAPEEVASGPAFLDDYAAMALGVLELYETTFDDRWLARGIELTDEMMRRFGAQDQLGYLGPEHRALVTRVDISRDASLPAPLATATWVLARLGHLTGNDALARRARDEIARRANEIVRHPTAYAGLMVAADYGLGPRWEVVIAGTDDAAATAGLTRVAQSLYLPRAALLRHGPTDRRVARLAPFVEKQMARGARPTAYVCRDYECSLPTHDATRLGAQLADRGATPRQP